MKNAALALCAAFAFTAPAFADNGCPAGQEPARIRVSTIKPTGTRAGFEEAAKDHMKWYRDHGFKDNEQVVLDVLTMDHGQPSASKTEVMTIHYNTPTGDTPRDAAWEAFTAKYRANSDIKTQIDACLPKHK